MDTGKTHPPLIIGSGIAGLLTALQLSPHPCLVVTQGNLADASDTASAHAQGGIAAAIGRGDSPDQHAQDTVRAGAGLTDRTVAARVTAAAPEMIAALIQFGVTFDSDPDGSLRLGLEGGHGRRRIIHAADHTGAEIMRALKSAVRAAPHITVWEHTRARCLHQRGGRMSAITLQ
ncbi:MAG TPA: FAD-dependent oxidoreductase, partial [Actinomycetales bacterium]|nr:FAD-dependent oxidoreductase [Actinomycetales bacterium]